jgi:methyl-accepting chemotaxis protein
LPDTRLKNFTANNSRNEDAERLWTRLMDDLPAVSQGLLDSCQKVEPDFLELGNRLQAVHTQANELTRMTLESAQGKSGEDNADILNDIVGNAQQALIRLRTSHDKMAGSVLKIAEVIQLLAKLNSTACALNHISKMLKMVGLNISVESARDEEARQSFQLLAEEIKGVAGTVSKASAAMRDDAENVGRHLAGAGEQIDHNLKQLETLAQSADASLKAAAPKAQSVYDLSRDAIRKAGVQAERISSRVGQIVVGIQIHDNISQRVDHIAKSLLEINAIAGAVGSGSGETVEGENLGAAYAVFKLQDTQLEHLISEIKGVGQSSIEAFDTISAIVDEIVADLDHDAADHRPKADGSDPVKALKSVLTSLQALLGQGAQRVALLRSAVETSTEASERLKEHLVHIRDINFDIHLKALNALVRSNRLGAKGRAIGALVQEIKELAVQSDDFVLEVEAIISDVNGIIDGLRGDFLADGKDDDGHESIDVGIQRFSAACRASADSALDLCRLGTILKSDLQDVASKLAFLDRFDEALSSQRRDLEQWAEQLSPWADSAAATRLFDESRIAQRYTMDQERRIHQASLGGPPPEESKDKPEAVPAEDGIEWFNDGSVDEPTAERTEIERRDAAAVAADEMDDFGDNVELF